VFLRFRLLAAVRTSIKGAGRVPARTVCKKLLGLGRSVVEDVEMTDVGALVVSVRPAAREHDRCPHCRRRCPAMTGGKPRSSSSHRPPPNSVMGSSPRSDTDCQTHASRVNTQPRLITRRAFGSTFLTPPSHSRCSPSADSAHHYPAGDTTHGSCWRSLFALGPGTRVQRTGGGRPGVGSRRP
jgi:hypothetical protein